MKRTDFKKIIDEIRESKNITKEQLASILSENNTTNISYLFESAREVTDKVYGREIYIRGLIEFTNYCHNDCYYCGIRKSNKNIERYCLDKGEILSSVESGSMLGIRTFVLQGGECNCPQDDSICDIIRTIKEKHPDCAVTLSIGEKSYTSFKKYRCAGADRYLLRHETADEEHYKKLHPVSQTFENRMRCLEDLKSLGFQTGCGFMVGSPFQTLDCIYKDLKFIKRFEPQMVGIGPFIRQRDTPFGNFENGSVDKTLKLLSIIRLIHPAVLLPSTTALATLDEYGREKGIMAGCNVLMPNLTPESKKKQYLLYDNKACIGEDSSVCMQCLKERIEKIGFRISFSRGDYKKIGDEEIRTPVQTTCHT